MILLSIDPGLEKTGYAFFDKDKKYSKNYRFLSSGLIKTAKKLPKEKRLFVIYKKLSDLIKKYQPKEIVFENIFFFKNQKTVISVAQAQGVIMLLSSQNNIPLKCYSPLEIKQTITGYGLADKKAVKKMIGLTLDLKKNFADDDEYDAIAIGLAYCFRNSKLLE